LTEEVLIVRKIRFIRVVSWEGLVKVGNKWRGASGDELGNWERVAETDDVLHLEKKSAGCASGDSSNS
jgi:hypothetical protein